MKRYLATFALLAAAPSIATEFNFNGFGTIAAGSIISGDGYIADYPNMGVYERSFDLGQETRLGLQGEAKFDDKLSATLQIMSRAANDYEAPQQLKAYWAKLVFTGQGTPPKEVDNDAAVLKLVAENPNIIGYIDAAAVNSSVRVVGIF